MKKKFKCVLQKLLNFIYFTDLDTILVMLLEKK
jgi:hypothetical protein